MAALSTAATKPKSLAIITASTRQRRLGPSVTELVQARVSKAVDASSGDGKPSLHLIDLATDALPWLDEPEPPIAIKDPAKYAHAHTRQWSATISSHDAFIFVTPQYNWSIPGVLKNALDFLYNEWTGKSALIVSYGGRGGDKAQEALRSVLQGLRMQPINEAIGLPLSDLEGGQAQVIGEGALSNPEEAWKAQLDRLQRLVSEQWL